MQEFKFQNPQLVGRLVGRVPELGMGFSPAGAYKAAELYGRRYGETRPCFHPLVARPWYNGRVRLKQVTVADLQAFVAAHVTDLVKKRILIETMNDIGVSFLPDMSPDRFNECLTRWRRAIRKYEREKAADTARIAMARVRFPHIAHPWRD